MILPGRQPRGQEVSSGQDTLIRNKAHPSSSHSHRPEQHREFLISGLFSSLLAKIKLCQERSKARGWSGFAPKGRGCSAPSCQAGPFGGSRCHLGDGKDLVTRIWEAPPASRGKIRDEDCFKCCTARRESPIVPDHRRTGKLQGPQTAGRKNLIRPFLNLCFLFFSFSERKPRRNYLRN